MPSTETREQLDEINRLKRIRYKNDKEFRKTTEDTNRRYRTKHRLHLNELQRIYREKNKEKVNKRCKTGYYKKKQVVHKLLGNKCKNCGEDEPMYFQVDHVNNDGHLEGAGTLYIIKKYLETPERYQLLCANCNQAKKLNGGKLYKPKKKRKGTNTGK